MCQPRATPILACGSLDPGSQLPRFKRPGVKRDIVYHQKGTTMRTDIAGRSGFPSRLATAVLLLALLLPALVTGGAAQETEGDKVLRVRMPRWPDTLDP